MTIPCLFQGWEFWAVSVTSFENTLGRWIREEKSACWSGIQVQCVAVKVAVLFVSLVSISFHCWSAWAHVAGQRSIVFWQWNETRQVEFHFQARFTFVVVESTQKFIFHSLVFLTLSIFWKVWIVIIDHLPWHFQLCNLLVTSCIFRFFFPVVSIFLCGRRYKNKKSERF